MGLFNACRHRHAKQGGDFVIVMADTILRDDEVQEVDTRGSDRVLFGDSFILWRLKT